MQGRLVDEFFQLRDMIFHLDLLALNVIAVPPTEGV